MRAFLDDNPITEPVHDYVTDIEARLQIFREFQMLHERYCAREPDLGASVFATFMVTPILGLQEFVARLKRDLGAENPNVKTDLLFCFMVMMNMAEAIEHYTSISPSSTDQSTTRGVESLCESLIRNAMAVRSVILSLLLSQAALLIHWQCKNRDQQVCIFTHSGDPEAAHIFPFKMSTKHENLRSPLSLFWGYEKQESWISQFFNPEISQSARNLLSLSPLLHTWWNRAKFALKPLRREQNAITVQWHWLKAAKLFPTQIIPKDFDPEELIDPQGWGDGHPQLFAHRPSGRTIRTGQTFTIRADYPEHLPSFELLELQWNILRIAAISGATDLCGEADDDNLSLREALALA